MTTEFRKDDNYVYFDGKYMEVYIPEMYFEKDIAEIVGDHFRTMGVLNFRTFSDIDGTKPGKLRTFNLPIDINTYPSGGYDIKKMDLVGNKIEDTYYVCKYYNGDKFCTSKNAASRIAFERFLNILIGGKLPATLPYKDVIDIWNRNLAMNGISFDIPDVVKEVVIASIYKSKSDPHIPFSKVIGKNPKTSQYAYITASPRDIAKQSSTYIGISFENMDEMLINGINNGRYGKKEIESPMEEVLKY